MHMCFMLSSADFFGKINEVYTFIDYPNIIQWDYEVIYIRQAHT